MKKKVKVISKKKMHTKKEEKLEIHNEENIDNGRIKWSLQIVDINKLKPYEKNPRIITEEALLELENSFNEIGMCQPLVVSDDFSIISGNARYLQLKKEGCDTVQVMIPDRKLTEKQEKAVVIRMNKTIVGKWDFDSLANNYEIIDLMDWGFTTEELIGVEEEKIDPKCDEDEVPEVKDTITKRGDIWLLGNHRVMCGDSTMIDDVEKLMAGEKADMVFTDPPYNINYQDMDKKFEKIKNDKMSDEDFTQFLKDCLNQECKAIYVCCSWQYMHLFKKSMEEIEKPVKSCIIWNKVNPAQNLDKYFKQHEIILYHGPFGGQKTLRGDVWELKRQRNTLHPTMKPVELIVMALEDNEELNKVLDLFSGSGSTLIACEKLGRKFYGMELDEKYCDIIINRWQKYTGKEAILESTGEKYNNLIK